MFYSEMIVLNAQTDFPLYIFAAYNNIAYIAVFTFIIGLNF